VATIVVGALNCTPDSFSDGGLYTTVSDAVAAGLKMAEAGARWIDVGGESTRPGARPVSANEEAERVLPAIESLANQLPAGVRISIDTYKAETACLAVSAGATVINDISGGLLDPEILHVAAQHRAGFVAGHLRGTPSGMMEGIRFDDVVAEVTAELCQRLSAARAAGCEELWADPGIGFGKTTPHNLRLLAQLKDIRAAVGVPLMVGVSRKRFIGDVTGRPTHERDFATAGVVALAVAKGVEAVRVHNVSAMNDVVGIVEAICAADRS